MHPIAAISTPSGRSGIGIIRISFGNLNFSFIENIFLNLFKKKLKPRYATNVDFWKKNKILDKGIAIFFKKPKSYTGENLLEFHGHGNYLNLKLILNFLIKKFKIYNFKFSKPGEFTKRAFLNKKINLFQLENIYNIINFNNKYFLNLVHKSFRNNFILEVKYITNFVKDIIFILEKEIFLLKKNIYYNINYKLNYIFKKIKKIIKNLKFIKSNKIIITLLGFVNVGKSSIINKIIKDNYSIVSNIPGTTRDLIKNYFNFNNFIICFIDTAGIRYTDEKIENLSIKLTIKIKKKSDILIFIFDNFYSFINFKKSFFDKKYYILIFNKIDLFKKRSNLELKFKKKKKSFVFLSNKFNIGLIFLFNEVIRLLILQNKNYFNNNLNNILKKKIFLFYKNIKKSIYYNKKKLNFFLLYELKKSFYNVNYIISNKIKLKKINIIFNNLCIGK